MPDNGNSVVSQPDQTWRIRFAEERAAEKDQAAAAAVDRARSYARRVDIAIAELEAANRKLTAAKEDVSKLRAREHSLRLMLDTHETRTRELNQLVETMQKQADADKQLKGDLGDLIDGLQADLHKADQRADGLRADLHKAERRIAYLQSTPAGAVQSQRLDAVSNDEAPRAEPNLGGLAVGMTVAVDEQPDPRQETINRTLTMLRQVITELRGLAA